MSKDGSDEIIRQLDRLIAGLRGSIPEEAGRGWLEQDAKPEAKRLVPVASGATRDSIDGTAGPGGITIFAGTDYARAIEEGTSKMAARQFLKPAVKNKLPRLGDHLKAAIKRRI